MDPDVDVPFTLTCGGTTSKGTVASWEAAGMGSGAIDCDELDVGISLAVDEAETIRRVRELRCDGR